MANAFQIAESLVGQAVDVDGAYGAQCLTSGYLVELLSKEYKPIEDLQAGDKLSTGNTVLENFPKKVPTFWLKTSQGIFKTTYDHKVFTKEGFKEVSSLTHKDEIILNNNTNENDYTLTDNEWRFFGLFLGDGSTSYRWKNSTIPDVRVTLGTGRKYSYVESLSLNLHKRRHSNGKAFEYHLINKQHRELAELIHLFRDKSIRDVFTKDQYKLILEGYLIADGTVRGNSYIASSVNKQLLVVLQHGAHVNGWSAVLGKEIKREKTNFSNNPKPLWKLSVNKHKKLTNRFISLTPAGLDTVYIMNTDGNHAYFADNQLHHNCADLAQYVGRALGITLQGNGNQIGLIGNVQAFADVIPYVQGMQLQTGDIISLDDTTGTNPYGHVVVYGSGDVTNALLCDQNYDGKMYVQRHRYNLLYNMLPLRIVRFRNQDNYAPVVQTSATDNNGVTTVNQTILVGNTVEQTPAKLLTFYEITCEKVEGIVGNGDNTVLDTFFKCNKISGTVSGDWLLYNRYTGSVGYIPKNCVKLKEEYTRTPSSADIVDQVNSYDKFPDKTSDGIDQAGTQLIYTLGQFLVLGRINWGGYDWTYYSQQVLPGGGLDIPGRHLNAHGYVSDKDGYIVLAAPDSWGNVKGNVYETPFGYKGKVYDVNAGGNALDVYIR